MPIVLLADVTVSTTFLVVSCIAIAIAALFIFVGLFGPGLRYKVSATNSEDNTSDQFLCMIEVLTDAQTHDHMGFTVLTNGQNFYEDELRAIAAAKSSVNLEAYIFERGEIADRYIEALTERARSGVKVNVVLDGLGSAGTGDAYFSVFKKAGGKLAWYNSAKWYKLPSYNHRTHRELMVIDGCIGYIGGAGVADQWYKAQKKSPRWRDTVVRIEGRPVANLQATFAENWLESCGEILTGEEYFPELPPAEKDATAFIVNSTPSAGGSTRARILFQLLLASAKKSIHITTPYFLPDTSMIHELVRAKKERGVEVTLLVPGKRSDHMLTRSSSRHAYGELLKAGAEIFEYQPAMIHAKILLIDGLWSVVGSTNFDNRSFGLNDEVNLAVKNEAFNARLQADYSYDISQSQQISYEKWRHRPILERAPEFIGWVFERQQ